MLRQFFIGLVLLYFSANCKGQCDPECRNGGICIAENSTCVCPITQSGQSCELPPMPKSPLIYHDELSITNGSLFNWNTNISLMNTFPSDHSILLYNGSSTVPGWATSKSLYNRSPLVATDFDFVIHGVVTMSNESGSGSKLAVYLAPGIGLPFVNNRWERFTGLAFVFDAINGTAYAISSVYNTSIVNSIANISVAHQSKCIANATVSEMLHGRFVFEIVLKKVGLSLTLRKDGYQSVQCLNQVIMPQPLYTAGLPSIGVAACCGESDRSFVSVGEMRVYAKSGSHDCSASPATDNMARPGDFIPRLQPGQICYCPINTQGYNRSVAIPNRTIPLTCSPYNNYKILETGQLSCRKRKDSSCDPPCVANGTCSNGICQCPLSSQQQPDCRFDSRYLPNNMVAFFPMSVDTFYYKNGDAKSKFLLDKSGSSSQAVADFNSFTNFPNFKTLCIGCQLTRVPQIAVPSNNYSFGAAVRVSLTTPSSRYHGDNDLVTTFLMFVGYQTKQTRQYFTWKNSLSSKQSYLTVGEDEEKLYVQYNSSSNSSFSDVLYTNLSISGTSENYQLLTVFYYHNSSAVEIWLPLKDNRTSVTIPLTDFVPPGPGIGEMVHIGYHPNLGSGLSFKGGTSFIAACFGVMLAKPTVEDIQQYVDACFYEHGDPKVPTMFNKLAVPASLEINGLVVLSDGTVLDTATWNDDLNDRNSKVFAMAVEAFLPAIRTFYRESGYAIEDVNITGFHQGSIIADYIVALRSLTSLTEVEIQQKVTATVQKLAASGSIIGGINWSQVQSFTIAKGAAVFVATTPPMNAVGSCTTKKVQPVTAKSGSKASNSGAVISSREDDKDWLLFCLVICFLRSILFVE